MTIEAHRPGRKSELTSSKQENRDRHLVLARKVWQTVQELPENTDVLVLWNWNSSPEKYDPWLNEIMLKDIPIKWRNLMSQCYPREKAMISRILWIFCRNIHPLTLGTLSDPEELAERLRHVNPGWSRGLGAKSLIFFRAAFQGEGLEESK